MTGQRFLGGYGDAQSEYQALMAAGVTFAKAYHLTPGVSLTPEQMATLTTDIVWLTTRTVTLADGNTQQVLVPQVYLRRLGDGDLQPAGALIAAGSIQLQSSSDIVNQDATIRAAGTLSLAAANDLSNQGGQLRGQDVLLSAGRDLNNIGGRITANDSLTATAGRDIVLRTTTQSSANAFGTRTNIDRVATVQGGDVSLAAARDLLAQGAQLAANGTGATLVASAGGDLRITAVQTASTFNASLGGSGGVNGRGSYFQESTQTLAGSSLHSDGSATLVAGKQLALAASELSAVGSVALAGANVSIEAGIESRTSDAQVTARRGYNQLANSSQTLTGGSVQAGTGLTIAATGKDASGVGIGDITLQGAKVSTTAGAATLSATRDVTITSLATADTLQTASKSTSRGFLSSKTTTTQSSSSATTQNASSVGGETVAISAGRDVTVAGSQVVSDQGTALTAGRDVNIASTVNNQTEHTQSQTTKSGLLGGGGIGVTIGTRDLKQTTDHAGDTAAASTVASIGGDVSISAGRAYNQVGSSVQTPQGNVAIQAQSVDIIEAQEKAATTSTTEFKQSGLTIALSAPGLSAASGALQAAQRTEQTQDSRMQALAAVTAIMKAKQAVEEIQKATQAGASDADKSISLSLTVGTSQSKSTQTQAANDVASSSIAAGGNVSIRATGAGQDSNLHVRGADITGQNVMLAADNQVSLESAQSTHSQNSSQQSSSAAVGVAISIGQKTSLGYTASASMARGNQDGTDTEQVNTHVRGGQGVSIVSGGDTTLAGAVVSAPKVTADIGGNLNVQSRQDTATFKSKSESASASATAGAGFSANASLSQSKVSADYAAVAEQSGIRAGDQGFQVTVKGNTDLQGGAITSNQAAIDAGRNSFSTGSLTSSDVANHSQYSAKASTVSVGTSGGMAGAFNASGNDRSTTRSTVSAGATTITGADPTSSQAALAKLDRGATSDATAGKLAQGWDGQSLGRQASLNASIVANFGAQASKEIGSYADAQYRQAKAAGDEAGMAAWAEGGSSRVALHGIVGGLTGNVQGAIGAVASAELAPQLNELQAHIQKSLDDQGLGGKGTGQENSLSQALAKLATGSVAAAAGGIASGGSLAGAAAGMNEDFNNRQLHPSEIDWIKANAKAFAQSQGITEAAAESRLAKQAAREVDLVWNLTLGGGDDNAAKAFLAGSKAMFTNELGQQQQFFTATQNQYTRPEMLAPESTLNLAFIKKDIQPGVTRTPMQGAVDKLAGGMMTVATDPLGTGKAVAGVVGNVMDAAGSAVADCVTSPWQCAKGAANSVVDGFVSTGKALGEGVAVATDKDLQAQLNGIYGQDASGAQEALTAARAGGVVAAALGAGRAVDATVDGASVVVGKVADKLVHTADKVATKALVDSGGALDASGHALLDMSKLTNEQKGAMGDLFGQNTVKQIVPDGEKLARIPGPGETGIDDLYKVNRPDVDYVIVEYKFVGQDGKIGSQVLGMTQDGLQGSSNWISGSGRLEKAVNLDEAREVSASMQLGRTETWVVTTRQDGSTFVQVLDGAGKPKSVNTSKIIDPKKMGAKP